MIEFEFKFEFTALFKISLKQTYPPGADPENFGRGMQF